MKFTRKKIENIVASELAGLLKEQEEQDISGGGVEVGAMAGNQMPGLSDALSQIKDKLERVLEILEPDPDEGRAVSSLVPQKSGIDEKTRMTRRQLAKIIEEELISALAGLEK
jgi:hypothetical protein